MFNLVLEEALLQSEALQPLMGDRLFYEIGEQGLFEDQAVYRIISENRLSTNDGDAGEVTYRVQFDVYGRHYLPCATLAATLRRTVERLAVNGIVSAQFISASQGREPIPGETDASFHRHGFDFFILYKEGMQNE